MLNYGDKMLWESRLFEIASGEPHILVAKWDRNGEFFAATLFLKILASFQAPQLLLEVSK